MKPWSALVLAALLGLTGCASTARIPDGIQFRSENWFRAVESGFVVAPTSGVQTVSDPADAAAVFTNHFYPALMVSLPGSELVAPEPCLYRLRKAGDAAMERFGAVRQALVDGTDPDQEVLSALSADLEHRYLLVSWINEGLSEGIDDTAYDDYTTVRHSEDVRRFAYEKVQGRATAVVLDLWENEVLWRGAADYQTARLYGDDGAIREELAKARGAGAVRLAEYFSQL